MLAKSNGDKKEAYRAINNNLKKFFVSAYQSYVFNRVLAARMPDIDKIMQGDMAYLHRNGACFRVEDAGAEQARCDRFEISPTGPLFGLRSTVMIGKADGIPSLAADAARLDFSRETGTSVQASTMRANIWS